MTTVTLRLRTHGITVLDWKNSDFHVTAPHKIESIKAENLRDEKGMYYLVTVTLDQKPTATEELANSFKCQVTNGTTIGKGKLGAPEKLDFWFKSSCILTKPSSVIDARLQVTDLVLGAHGNVWYLGSNKTQGTHYDRFGFDFEYMTQFAVFEYGDNLYGDNVYCLSGGGVVGIGHVGTAVSDANHFSLEAYDIAEVIGKF